MTRRWPLIVALVAAVAYAASGTFVVAPDERGVARVLGRTAGPYPPGVHWTWPWPFARVDRPATSGVRRLTVAFADDERPGVDGLLTADSHVLEVVAGAQYQVVDPLAFVVAARDPAALVDHALRGALVETVAGLGVDDALTRGRAAIARGVQGRAQSALDDAGCGVLVVAVTLERLEAPAAVRPAFQDVVGARQDAVRSVDQARSEATALAAAADGEATRVVESARGRAARVGAEARGDAQRFTALLAEHRRAPQAVERRLLIETLETVVPRMRTYVVDDDAAATLRLVEPRDG